jgi:glycosyltransferase involved in cell wall biosynthesis/O-antigen/teichoic acid export membrane protein
VRIVRQTRRGKGNALACGFAAATGDIIAMVDADGSTDPAEIPRFVRVLRDGADFAKGTRYARGGGSDDLTWRRRVGNRMLTSLVNRRYRTNYTDLCYGFNAFWRPHVPVFGLDGTSELALGGEPLWGDGFEVETLINIRVALAGLIVTEVPSFEHRRIHGESKLSALADGWRILKTILRERRPSGSAPGCVSPADGGSPVGAGADRCVSSSQTSPESEPIVPASLGNDRVSRLSVSVVICVHTEDRWNDMLAAADSVRAQSYAAKELIMVVDHNPRLYHRLRSARPDDIVVENREQPGLSGGKNTGVSLASGEIVAFLDDDAVAEPTWLEYLLDAYADPTVVGTGGRTLPRWATRRPSWFPREFDWVVGCTYIGMPKFRAPVRNLMGGNASFRREVFSEVGAFTTGIGRSVSGRPLGCEETEFCIRLSQRLPGTILLFDGRAVIRHRVPAPRERFSYYRSRCYAEGLSKAMVTRSVGTGDGLAAERRYTSRTLPRGVARGLGDALRGDATGLVRAGAIIAGLATVTAGYAVGSLPARPRADQAATLDGIPPGAPARSRATSALAAQWRRLRTHLADPLFRNGYALMLNTAITAPLGLVYWLFAARHYPPADVGRASAAYAAMGLLSGFTAHNIFGVLTRFIPQWGRRTRSLVALVYVSSAVASAAITVPFLLTMRHWGRSFGFLAGLVPGLLFAGCVVAWALFTLQDGVLTGLRSAVWVPVENGLFGVFKIILLLALAAALPVTGIEISWMLPVVLSLPLVNMLIFGRLIPRHMRVTGDRPPVPAGKIRQFLVGDYAGNVSVIAISNLVPVVVAARIGPGMNAYFYMAWMISATLDLLSVNMAMSLTVEGAFDQGRLADDCRAALRRTLLLLVPLVGGLVALAPWALSIFGPGYAANGAPVLEFLAIATLPNALIEVYLGALRAQSRTALVALIQTVRGIGVLGLALWLSGAMGIRGVGVAVLASQAAVAVAVAPGLWHVMAGAKTHRMELVSQGEIH